MFLCSSCVSLFLFFKELVAVATTTTCYFLYIFFISYFYICAVVPLSKYVFELFLFVLKILKRFLFKCVDYYCNKDREHLNPFYAWVVKLSWNICHLYVACKIINQSIRTQRKIQWLLWLNRGNKQNLDASLAPGLMSVMALVVEMKTSKWA